MVADRFVVRVVAALLVLACLVGCGSGATEGPDAASNGDDGAGGGSSNGGSGGGGGGEGKGGDEGEGSGEGEGGEEFSWGLPVGDVTVSLNEDVLYRIIQRGACDEAQDFIDELWNTLRGPRAVLLYQSAIYFCQGDRNSAQQAFDQAGSDYGWTGISSPYLDCNVFKAATSVLQQVPPDSVPCEGGIPPGWPAGDPEDPRGGAGDGATSTTDPDATTTESTDESTTESTDEPTTESTDEPTTESTSAVGNGGSGTSGE